MTAIILGLAALVAIAIAGYRIKTLEQAYRHKERILDDQIDAMKRLMTAADETKRNLDRQSTALGLMLKKISPFADAIDKTY